MPRWLSRLREGSRGAEGETALLERPEPPRFELPPDLPVGVDGALWASWAARWQEFWEPAITGGPPVRGDILPLWRLGAAISDAERETWRVAAQSIAIGVELVAHLEPLFDLDAMRVGFCCDSEDLAELLAQRVRAENVDAESCRAHPGGSAQFQACDVVLPCRPNATREEVDHAVLAATKAAHGILCPVGAR